MLSSTSFDSIERSKKQESRDNHLMYVPTPRFDYAKILKGTLGGFDESIESTKSS